MTFIVAQKALQKMVHVMPIGNKTANYPSGDLGFTYIGLLIFIAISGVALAGVGIVWHQDAQREREKELLFIGEEFRNAIGSYYENSPSVPKQFPQKIEQLLLDDRFPTTKRHLRKFYKDPINRSNIWGLEIEQGHIIGLYSLSVQKPIKKYGFPPQYDGFGQVDRYTQWKFVYLPGSNPANVVSQNDAS